MKSVLKRILCVLLVLLMLPLYFAENAVEVQAAYENTYVNTGNQRQDLIGVAMTQVGYREVGGVTKYGEWYGHPSVDWCAVFVCWCANQAGIPTSVIKKQGWANPASFGWTAYPASQRLPKPGDIYFKGKGTHTGIVIEVKEKTFVTVEGNTWLNSDTQPRVMIREFDLYNSYYTFASPNYNNDYVGSTSCKHNYETGNDSAHPHNEYKKCTLCGYKTYTGNSVSLTSCTDCKQAACSHSYGAWSKLDGTYHRQTCTLCSKVNKAKHSWGSDEIIKEATCSDPGEKLQTCATCNATREVEIPVTDRHEYTECLFVDKDTHMIKCESCDRNIERKHTLSGWKSDALSHWKECSECGGRVAVERHNMENGCGSKCKVCSQQPNTSHMFRPVWQQDEQIHWQQCVFCSQIQGQEEHQFTAECDDTCDVCQLTRQAEHIYAQELTGEMTGHWLQCQICGQPNEVLPHEPGDPATEQTPQLCTQCSFEITPKLIHKHVYTYTTDDRTHRGVCACGAVSETAGHAWDVETGQCEICRIDVPPEPRQMLFNRIPLPNISDEPMIWMIVSLSVAGLLLIAAIVLLIIAIRRSLKIAAAERLLLELDDDDDEEDETLDGIEPEEAVPIPDGVDEIVISIPIYNRNDAAAEEPAAEPIAEEPAEPVPAEPAAEEVTDVPEEVPEPVLPEITPEDDEDLQFEDLLRRVAQIEGVSYEECIGQTEPAEMPPLEQDAEKQLLNV